MHVYQRIWYYLQQHRVASIVVGHVTVVGVLGLLLLGNGLGMNIFGAFAQSSCSSSDHTYIGRRSLTPGNGRHALITSTGVCRARLQLGLSWICSRGCRELIASAMSPWSKESCRTGMSSPVI